MIPTSRRHRVIAAVCAVTIAGTAAVAVAATAPKSGKWAGTTSEHSTVTFAVSSNHKQVTNFITQLGYNGACGQGGGAGFGIKVARMAITPQHTFSASTIARAFGITIHVKINGSFSGGKATGAVKNPANVCSGVGGTGKGRFAYAETFSATHA